MSFFPEFLCPFCGSCKVSRRCWGRKAGGLIGSIAGAAGGFAGCLRSIQTGSMSGVAGTILGCLAGSAIGCEVGAAVGETIDSHVLNDFKCEDCLRSFPVYRRPSPETSASPQSSSFTSFE